MSSREGADELNPAAQERERPSGAPEAHAVTCRSSESGLALCDTDAGGRVFRAETISSAGEPTVLELEGELDLQVASAFRDVMMRAIEDGALRIVVDMTKVSFIDSTGLGVFASGLRSIAPRGGAIAVAGERPIRRVFERTGLHKVFPLCRTREEAVRATVAGTCR
jgi:anti-sigma B factor antagonist